MAISTDELGVRAAAIRYFFTDVDGTLTDGTSLYTADGEYAKCFSLRDGGGFYMLRRVGIETGILTGETTPIVRTRAEKLQLTHCYMGIADKMSFMRRFVERQGCSLREVAYIGDDLNDYALLKVVGLSFCPCDAHPLVRNVVDFVSSHSGGKGAFRECAERLAQCRCGNILDLYSF